MVNDGTKTDEYKAPNAGEAKKPCCKGSKTSKICKASELPMYGNPYPPQDVVRQPGMLEEGVRTAREAISPNMSIVRAGINRSIQFVNTGISHARSTFDKVRDEKNDIAKAGAITGGGLLGLLYSARKGFFKKLFYIGFGVGTVAGICYPKKSYELLEISGYIVTKKLPVVVKDYTGVDVESMIPTRKKNADADAVAAAELSTAAIAKDRDQSSPVDKNMISNRSTK